MLRCLADLWGVDEHSRSCRSGSSKTFQPQGSSSVTKLKTLDDTKMASGKPCGCSKIPRKLAACLSLVAAFCVLESPAVTNCTVWTFEVTDTGNSDYHSLFYYHPLIS